MIILFSTMTSPYSMTSTTCYFEITCMPPAAGVSLAHVVGHRVGVVSAAQLTHGLLVSTDKQTAPRRLAEKVPARAACDLGILLLLALLLALAVLDLVTFHLDLGCCGGALPDLVLRNNVLGRRRKLLPEVHQVLQGQRQLK